MRIIKKRKNIIIYSYPNNEYDNINDYHLANYCIVVSNNTNTVIYNGLTQEIIKYSNDEYEQITKFLIDRFYLIKDDNLFLYHQLSLKNINENPINYKNFRNFVISTTTKCNANCFYCYEAGIKKTIMSDETAEAIANYIISQYDGKTVSIRWFGGEPLYNKRVIDIISNKLNENNVEFTSSINTNASLITETDIDAYKNIYKLNNFQITLDGTKDVYETYKSYADSTTFEKVLNNIELLLTNDFKVTVRLNVTQYNTHDLISLIDILHDKFSKFSLFYVYCNELYDLTEDEKPIMYSNTLKINNYIYTKFNKCKRRFEVLTKTKSSHCMADSNSGVFITADGKLTPCEHYHDSEIIGDVYTGITNIDTVKKWRKRTPITDVCTKCPFLTSCHMIENCPAEPKCYLSEKTRDFFIEQSKYALYKYL